MDLITLPIVSADLPLERVWRILEQRRSSAALIPETSGFLPIRDESVAEALRERRRTVLEVVGDEEPIPQLDAAAFTSVAEEYLRSSEIRRMHHLADSGISRVVGRTPSRVRSPVIAGQLAQVFDRLELPIAVVGLSFGTATILSASEGFLSARKIWHGGPGRYQCSCDGSHLYTPEELIDKTACPQDGCPVGFVR